MRLDEMEDAKTRNGTRPPAGQPNLVSRLPTKKEQHAFQHVSKSASQHFSKKELTS
jgi:hypothetical protein